MAFSFDSGDIYGPPRPQPFGEKEQRWLQGYLANNPQAAYLNAIPTTGSPKMQDYWGRNYGSVLQDFNQQVAKGNPYLNFPDFLKNYEWLQKYYGQSPQQRGDYTRNFAPPAMYSF